LSSANAIGPVTFQLVCFRSSETLVTGAHKYSFSKDEIVTKGGSRLKAHATDSNRHARVYHGYRVTGSIEKLALKGTQVNQSYDIDVYHVSVTLRYNVRVLRTREGSASVLSHGCNNRDVDTPPMTQVTYNTISPPMTVVS